MCLLDPMLQEGGCYKFSVLHIVNMYNIILIISSPEPKVSL